MIHPQEADELLIAGDMHGNLDNFRRLLQKADLARLPKRHLVLQEVIHGPFHYPTGGDKSHQLLDLVCALKCQYPRQVHLLMGNHELAQLAGRKVAKFDQDLNVLFLQGIQTAYGHRADEIYALYRELFACAPLAIRTANRVFISHSLPSPSTLSRFQLAVLEQDATPESALEPSGSVYALVWGRDVREETTAAFLQKVDADLLITGHIHCEEGYLRPNPYHVIVDSQGSPAGYCLLPVVEPLTRDEWEGCLHLL